MAFEVTPSLGSENLVGSVSEGRVTCQYQITATAGQVFTPTFRYNVGQDGTLSIPGGQNSRIVAQSQSAFDGSITSGCPSFTGSDGWDYLNLGMEVQQSGTGLAEMPIITWTGISVLTLIVLLFAGYSLFKRLANMADEGEDPESAIEYYHDDNGQERWRMKALTRWRMEQ